MMVTSETSANSLKHIQPEPLTLEEMQKAINKSNAGETPAPFVPHNEFPILRKILGYLNKCQKYTGYLFSAFAGLHLTSVVISPGLGLSMDKTQDLFEMARSIYLQIPGFEFTFITGATVLHIFSGVGIRIIRNYIKHQNKVPSTPNRHNVNSLTNLDISSTSITNDGRRDDIGLGGLGSLFGLGYRRAWISRLTPELTPLTFSGYLLIPVGLIHYAIFRWAPMQVDGDSSLVTLKYIAHALKYGDSPWSGFFHYVSLVGLVWLGSYHMVTGLWKLRRRFSARDKKLGYILVNGLTFLSLISLSRIRTLDLDFGFMGKQYIKYLQYLRL